MKHLWAENKAMTLSPLDGPPLAEIRQHRLEQLYREYHDYFYLSGSDRVMGCGCCFGFHVLGHLEKRGFSVLNRCSFPGLKPDIMLPTGGLYTPGELHDCFRAAWGELPFPISVRSVTLKDSRRKFFNQYRVANQEMTYHEPYPFVVNVPLAVSTADAERELDLLLAKTRTMITDADVLVITLGTAYEYRVNGICCLKSSTPNEVADYRLMQFVECRDAICDLIEYLLSKNSRFRLIMSVSPVFHSDRLCEQNLQKSLLVAAVREALAQINTRHGSWKTVIRQELIGAGRVVLYGSGRLATEMINAAAIERKRIVALVDERPERWGQDVLGLPIVAPHEIPRLAPDSLMIASSFLGDVLPRARVLCDQYRLKLKLVQKKFCYFPSYEIIQFIGGPETVRADYSHIRKDWIQNLVFPFFTEKYLKVPSTGTDYPPLIW